MQGQLYRRNYYLALASGQQNSRSEKKDQIVYEESAKIINQMISHIKNLLWRTISFRQETISIEDLVDFEDKTEKFRAFEKNVPLTFFTTSPIDSRMSGAFVMRLCKEMSYWKPKLPFLSSAISELDQHYHDQQKASDPSIALLYFICVKRIFQENAEYIKDQRQKITDIGKEPVEQPLPSIFLVPIFSQSLNIDHLKKQKNHLEEMIDKALSRQYRGLDIQEFDAVNQFALDMSYQENTELLLRRQIVRNKKMRKQIKEYKTAYENFLDRKQRRQSLRKIRKISEIHALQSCQDKKSYQNTLSKKSIEKQIKLALPRLMPSKFIERSQSKSLNKQNMKGTSKQKKLINKQRVKIELKLRL